MIFYLRRIRAILLYKSKFKYRIITYVHNNNFIKVCFSNIYLLSNIL